MDSIIIGFAVGAFVLVATVVGLRIMERSTCESAWPGNHYNMLSGQCEWPALATQGVR